VERKLAAILCADVFGFSRLMGQDEEATLRTLTSHRKLIDFQIENHHGRFVNSAGDSVLAEFASVVEAVNCAVDIQNGLKAENAILPPERRMEFRIGVNLGDVMVEGAQIYGDGVNVAARLESLAEPGGICISNTVHDQVRNKLVLSYEDLGGQSVKNIAEPVRVYRVLLNGAVAASRTTRRTARRYWRGGVLSLAGLAIILVTVVLVQHLSLKPPRSSASIPPQERPALPLPTIPSIAVLPFTNLSGDPQQEYFSDGISDQLINNLSRLPGLFVIARNSSFAYKGKNVREQEIGKELGVKTVLEGSVLKTADRIRVGVELVDANNGAELWTSRYDRPITDIFAMQDEIVDKVVTTLGLLITLGEMKLPHPGGSRTTDNIDALDDFLHAAEYFWRFTKDDNVSARQWDEKAIQLDPKFAWAYSSVGWTYFFDALNRWSANPEADLAHASEVDQKALSLDDSNVDALTLLSALDSSRKRPEQAIADAERAIAVNRNYAGGYEALANAYKYTARSEEGIRATEEAIRLDPANQDYYGYLLGPFYNNLGRYREAIPILKRTIAVYPNMLVARTPLIFAYIELGRDQEARAEAAEVMRISPNFVVTSTTTDAALNQRFASALRKAGLK
jgi:adenylate cyclase